MFGEEVKIKCQNCEKENIAHFGICKTYEDDKGIFYLDENIKCECGHILNSERISNTKYIGMSCL